MKKAIVNEELHYEHTRVLAKQMVSDAIEVLEQHGLFTAEQNRDVTRDLMFRVFAVLDGSSYPGTMNGEEISPFVGFYLDSETDDLLVPEDGSAMHDFVDELLDEYFSHASSDKSGA
jgi:hypothetical protein